ncbi:MAG: cell division protein FtsZ [Candidatus Uhrbacteria bacterium]|nr:cell division protein FtsZ [Candidatus Uhrbacteria bacterium]MDP3793974.1 cell division protein FtsZ [Candidatus Uhrbacteria bacterium]
MPEIKPEIETFAKIKVVGVGGSGGASIKRMIASKIKGVEFVVMNTDVQALHYSPASNKLHIGKTVTRGLGAGMDPEMGLRAAEEAQNEIRETLKGADMVFVCCGLGGGTGTGAAPFIASVAKELGALTVAVVTKPFGFEGAQRKNIADGGYEKLAEQVDTIITIPNDRILQIIDRKTALLDAFEMVDDVLRQGVQGISELITVPGLINVDFADVRAIMANRGSALMGIGRGHGDNRAADAAKAAVASPLLEVSIEGAKGILFTITGGSNLGMYEVSEAAKVITQAADPQAKVIFGAIIDESLKDEVRITVIATGFESRMMMPKAKSAFASGGFAPRGFSAPEPLEKVSFQPPQRSAASASITLPSSVTDSIPANHQPHVAPPQYAAPTPRAPLPTPTLVSAKSTSADEDLEIPAFIRKKMM